MGECGGQVTGGPQHRGWQACQPAGLLHQIYCDISGPTQSFSTASWSFQCVGSHRTVRKTPSVKPRLPPDSEACLVSHKILHPFLDTHEAKSGDKPTLQYCTPSTEGQGGNNKCTSWFPRPGGQLRRVRTTVIWNSSLLLFLGCAALHMALFCQQNKKVCAKAESPNTNWTSKESMAGIFKKWAFSPPPTLFST